MVYDEVAEVGKNYKHYPWDVIVIVCTPYCAYAIECEVKVCNRLCKSQAFTADVAAVSSEWGWVVAMEMIWQHFWKFDEFLVGVEGKTSWRRSWLSGWCYNLILYKWMFCDHSKKLHGTTMEDKRWGRRGEYAFPNLFMAAAKKGALETKMNLLWIFLVVYLRCFLGTCRGQYI